MEVTIAWFWLVKLALLAIFFYALYKAFKTFYDDNSKIWNKWTTLSLIFAILSAINPIKLEPTTSNMNVVMDRDISDSKQVLPPMKVDDSFKEKGNLSGISKEELK